LCIFGVEWRLERGVFGLPGSQCGWRQAAAEEMDITRKEVGVGAVLVFCTLMSVVSSVYGISDPTEGTSLAISLSSTHLLVLVAPAQFEKNIYKNITLEE
jgi:hypothetical protein